MRPDKIPEPIHDFIEGLEKLAAPGNEDRAALAKLKRCVGRPPGECREALGLFYDLLPTGVRPSDEDLYFLIATLFPFAPSQVKEQQNVAGDFGRSLRRLSAADGVNADGVDRRMAILLDADSEALPFRLRQAVRMLAQKDIPIDWRLLLTHLLRWNEPNAEGLPSGRVQRQWARSYFNLRHEQPGDVVESAG